VLLGGEIESYLDSFINQGKKHLCIWSHGALHYLPFHLLPTKSGAILSDKWTITSIPAIAMGMQVNDTISDKQICVMAMTFTHNNPYNVSKIPSAISLTQPVANLFGTTVWNDNQLTEPAFKEKLQSASMIHLFTHGYLNIDAPSFHALFLEPGDGEDGILYAYEISNLNLHHIDLLTLCACESALGRFDTADNLRGLPAAFFMAGVATIIGSLWDAEPTSAAYFFENLYTAIKAGATKRNAFKTAQTNTRKVFPAYRDWGAFYYMGK
jgi:CHAT domain-containing protein